jgi:hypothetical protein
MRRYMKIVILFGIVSMFADMTYEGDGRLFWLSLLFVVLMFVGLFSSLSL